MENYTGLEIAVIGMSGRFPGAGSIHQFWENLKNGKDSIEHLSDEELLREGVPESLINDPLYIKANAYFEDKHLFDAGFFGYRKEEVELMDPQMRIYHECCWEALEDSGYAGLSGRNTGVFSTATINPHWLLYALLKNKDNNVDELTASYLRDITYLSSRISYKFDLKGPSIFLQTACSSSLVAIYQACNSLLLGECSMALAGGVTIHNHSKKGYRYSPGLIYSADGKCRPFDAEASGTVGGEGAGVVILKRLKDAMKDGDHVYAIIKGAGINNDGRDKVGYTSPGVRGQSEAISRALKMAQVNPGSISYIEAHGTATALGDPVEVEALNLAYGAAGQNGSCALGSVKSNIGHLDSAAGVAGFIKTVLALKHKQLPPSLHFSRANEKINFSNGPFYVNSKLNAWPQEGLRRAAVSSFGIGGTNVHIILEEAPESPVSAGRQYVLLPVSAKSSTSLEKNLQRLGGFLQQDQQHSLADIAYTLQKGRERFAYREVFVADNKQQAAQLLLACDSSETQPAGLNESLKQLVFMFPGQGSQYVEMCRDLYRQEPFFRKILDECFDIAALYSTEDFKACLFPDQQTTANISQTRITQPVLFIVEFALAKLLMHWGIQPDYMIGHSIGEYVAATISGVFDVSDAIRLVIRRGELMDQVEAGSMLGVQINEQELMPLLDETQQLVDIAAINSINSIVVSGRFNDIEDFEKLLTVRGYSARKVNTSHAFHSRMMENVLEEFENELAAITIHEPRIPFISNITGELAVFEEIARPSYWSRHLRKAVHFLKGARSLIDLGGAVFIEVGPGRTLSNYIENCGKFNREDHSLVSLVRHPRQELNDQQYLVERLGILWKNGINIDWDKYYSDEKRLRVPLPVYAFDQDSFTTLIDISSMISADGKLQEKQTAVNTVQYVNTSSWRRATATPHMPAPEKEAVVVLISNGEQFSTAISNQLTGAGYRVIEVYVADHFEKLNNNYTVNVTAPADWLALWQNLTETGWPAHIVYAAALSATAPLTVAADARKKLDEGYIGLSLLAKTLSEANAKNKIHITVVNNYLATLSEQDIIDPAKTAIQGPVKVIPLELLNMSCRLLDVPFPFTDNRELEQCAELVTNELFFISDEPFVAFRNGARWLRQYNNLSETETISSGKNIVSGGTYIVTGAMGGMGFTIARDLVLHHHANVIMVHRSAFPQREEWEERLLHAGNDPVNRKIRQLVEMENTGCKVDLYQVDLSDESSVSEWAKTVKANYHSINGLIWAAGEVDYGGIIINRDDFEKYTTSKIQALFYFEKYIGFEGMDVVALFSSIGNVLYQTKFGQVAYVAANEFLEGLAYYLDRSTGIRAFTINWCDWLDVGMTFNIKSIEEPELSAALINSKITHGISPEEGCAVFQICLKEKNTIFTICREPLHSLIASHRKEFRLVTNDIQQPVAKSDNQPVVADVETSLLIIFADFFGRKEIKPSDSFFDLGGDSLRAMTLIGRINRTFGTDLVISDIYRYNTIRELLGEIRRRNSHSQFTGIPVAEPQSSYVLSSAQRRMYFLQMFGDTGTTYNELQILRLKGKPDQQKLKHTFESLVQRHDSLRTSFILIDGEPRQIISATADFGITYYTAQQEDVHDIIRQLLRPFDLSQAPLFRVGLITTAQDEHLLLIDMHHIITDGVSKDILIKDFMTLYAGKQLPALALQYKDYAVWQQSAAHQAVMQRHRDFWQGVYAALPPVLELPVDFPRSLSGHRGGGSLKFMLDATQTRALKQQAEAAQCTLFMMLLSYYVILLSKLGNQEDIVTGVPVSGRNHADVEGVAGMFVNTLPLRNYPLSELDYESFLQSLRSVCLSCFDHQDYPYEQLIDDLKVERQEGRHPLFDVMFSFRNFEESIFEIPGLQLEEYRGWDQESKFDLTLSAMEKDGTILLQFEYATTLFSEDSIRRLAAYYQRIADIVINDSSVKLGDISLLSASEREQQLYIFNNTQVAYDTEATVVSLFDACATANPDAIAVMYKDQELSYASLKDRSSRVGAYLQRRYGLQADDLVGILSSRNIELIIMIMGVLKSGAAYVPIDPSYPAGRRDTIITDSGMKLLITDRPETSPGCEVCSVEELLEAAMSEEATDHTPHGNDLAYVIYTSGSTGRPKGVMIEHQSVANYIRWAAQQYAAEENSSFGLYTSISFDLTVTSIFTPLITGNRIVVYEEKEGLQILEVFSDARVDVIKLTPSHLKLVAESTVASVTPKRLIVGGENFEMTLAAAIDSKFEGKIKIYNEYGPTETTVGCMIHEYHFLDPGTAVPLGVPIANSQIYLLDKDMHPVPPGVRGELYISGACVGRGYLFNEEQTRRSFIPNPFIEGQRLYQTGDHAIRYADGRIVYVGRADEQVKIRGYRIEPAEIEFNLVAFGTINAAVVITKGDKENLKLVAYYMSEQDVPEESLITYLGDRLPQYMIPDYFLRMEAFPLTVNGKLDKDKLPEPNIAGSASYTAPIGHTEIVLVKIMADTLKLDEQEVSTNSSFFELGGNSISALRVIYHIQKDFGVQVSLRSFFKHVTVSKLGAFIDSLANNQLPYISRVEPRDSYTTSSAQQRLYFEQLLNSNTTRYNVSGIFEFRITPDLQWLTQCFIKLIERHESLRTSFVLENEELLQFVHPSVDFKISVINADLYPDAESAFLDFVKPFDLAVSPLIRCALLHRKQGHDLLLVDIHHIVCDGISLNVLMNDFRKIYQQELLPLPDLRYVDYVYWQKQHINLDKQQRFWQEQLAGTLPVFDLPAKNDRSAVNVHAAGVKRITISNERWNGIKQLSSSADVSEFMILLSIQYLLMSKLLGQTDIIIGTDVAGRSDASLANVVGSFVNVLPLRMEVDPDITYAGFLHQVKDVVLSAYEHQDFQYDQILAMLKEENRLPGELFNIHFSFSNQLEQINPAEEWLIVPYELSVRNSVNYDLCIEVKEDPGNFQLFFVYSNELYDEQTIDIITTYYEQILGKVLDDQHLPITEIVL